MGILRIMFCLLLMVPQCICVGQMGGVRADLGRRNGALAKNTIRSRDGFMIKFRKFLELKDFTESKFYEAHQVQQCKILTHYWECMRKEKSYKKVEHRVCFLFFSDFRKNFFFVDFSEKKIFLSIFHGKKILSVEKHDRLSNLTRKNFFLKSKETILEGFEVK